ncbi:MAG TPA: hypothetical protein VGJ46_04460, partial [Candidatus Limnocylindrales bacterium]
MRWILGVVAAISAWLGWLTVCPALGFPTIATGPMFSRILVPKDDPGSWLGWALLLIGLVSVAVLYLALAARGILRPTIVSGAAYGAIWWLVAGAVVMPLLGLAFPAGPATTTPAALSPPDPMHGSFMMLHLGIGAPIATLIGWLMFGAVLGAASSSREGELTPRKLALGSIAAVVAVGAFTLVGYQVNAAPATASTTATRTLVTQPAQALPPGTDYFSVLELTQPSGAALGPHAHPYAGFAYSLKGVATLTFT